MEVRLQYLTKCPKEPPVGRGAIMNVRLGDEREKIDGGLASRRFDGDDTLADVLNWLGGYYGAFDEQDTAVYWTFSQCSGKLGVRLSEDSWRDGDEIMDDIHGSARGLGAASRSMLY
eukprot:scaffold12157_cov78-Skeletonema_dohrnii-CCMP3373.AAC.3